jgi:hypothetical protein
MFRGRFFLIVTIVTLALPLSIAAQSLPDETPQSSGAGCAGEFNQCLKLCRFQIPHGEDQSCLDGCNRQRAACCDAQQTACEIGCRFSPAPGCTTQCQEGYQACKGDSQGEGTGAGGHGWGPAPKPDMPSDPSGPMLPFSNRPPPPNWLDDLEGALCRCVNADELVVTPHGGGVRWNGKKGYVILGVGGCLQDQRMFCQIGFSF